MKTQYFLAFALIVQCAAFAQPAPADCSGLLQPAIVNTSKQTGQALAIASIFDSTLVSSQDKNKALGISYGNTSLDFEESELSKLRQIISQKFNYNYQTVADEKYLASFLRPDQLDAYVKCKEFSDNNPHANLYWNDTLSVVAPGARPQRTINVHLAFIGNNVVRKYKLDLKVNGKTSKLLPSSWGNLKSTQAFMLKTSDINSPISVIANFRARVGSTTAASITIPPVLPRINSRLKITEMQTEVVGKQCKGPAIVDVSSKPIYASTSDSSTSYLQNSKAVVTFRGGEAHSNNSKVVAELSKDRQQLVARVVCQAHSTNGDAQINGYAGAQDVALIIDSIDY